MAESTPMINDAGTLVDVPDDQEARYRKAGYRPLKAGEVPPIQFVEEEDYLAGLGIGQAASLAQPPSPSRIKSIRRAQAQRDGASG